MKRFISVIVAVVASMLVVGATQAFGATRTVGCNGQSLPSIQAAVNASSLGDSITVCAGTYTEQVSIPAGKNNLTLQSNGHLAAVIQAPATMTSPKAIVRDAATGFKMSDFQIQGPGSGGCDSLEYGVRIDGGGSATLSNNLITHIRDNPFSGCQNGVAIQAGRAQESTTGSVVAKNNVITDYQKNGITVSGGGSSGTINGNTITGAGPTAVIAQNGIQFSSGATGSATNNDVSGNSYSPATTTSTGVLLFGPIGAVTIGNNTLHNNDVSAYVFGSTAFNTTVSNNTISGDALDGVTLDSSTGAVVSDNTITGGDQGIGVYNTTNSTIKTNAISGSATNGIFADSATVLNKFRGNTVTGVTGPGHFACRDDSPSVLNTWTSNTGSPSSPSGLCSAPGGSAAS